MQKTEVVLEYYYILARLQFRFKDKNGVQF